MPLKISRLPDGIERAAIDKHIVFIIIKLVRG
jgi:hypothetical protein